MSIYISNSLYIAGSADGETNSNNPILCYKSVLTPSAITAPASASVSPPANAWTPDTAQAWVGEGVVAFVSTTVTQYLQIENTTGGLVDYIGIGRHNFGTAGLTHRIQHSVDGGLNWLDLTSDVNVGNDKSIVYYFDAISSGLFRIRITKTGTDIPSPIIGHVKLGTATVLQRRVYVGYSPAAIVAKVKRSQYGSENGQYLGQVVHRSYRTTSIEQENNSPLFFRQNIAPFIEHVNGNVEVEDTAPASFFYCWRPGDYPDECIYGWTRDNVEYSNQGGDSMGGRMSWSCSVEAIA